MKLILSVLMIVAAGIVRASGDAVSCSVIDYLYYSSDCCDNSNSVQCMESIPQTDKAAIDNLASLKRPEGAACESGDSIKFLNSKIVCTTADSCLIPCVNGNITGTVGTCTCACHAGFSGDDCSTATPCTACQNGGVLDPTGSVADGTCSCDCSGTNGHTGTLCEVAPPPTLTLHVDATGYSSTDVLTQQECWDNRAALLTAVLALKSDTTVTSFTNLAANAAGLTNSDSSFPKGCFIKSDEGSAPNVYNLYFNNDANGADPGAEAGSGGNILYIGINK